MRFTVEVHRIDDDRVAGIVMPDGQDRGLAFSGWLELIHLLEPLPVDGERTDGAPLRAWRGDGDVVVGRSL
ncbi:MAG: hypothetical protein ACREQ5_32110 [Candidatus Dormibacteria bacterium]